MTNNKKIIKDWHLKKIDIRGKRKYMKTEIFMCLISSIGILIGVAIILIIRRNKIKAELITLTNNIFDDLCNSQMRSTMYCIGPETIHINRKKKGDETGMVKSPIIFGNYQICFWYEDQTTENEIGVALWKNKKRIYRRIGHKIK